MSDTRDTTSTTDRFRLLAFASHGANDLYWFILPIVLPMMLAQYGLRYAGGGTVLSIYLLIVAVFSLIAGRVSDRVHRWRMIGGGFLLTSIGFVSSALVTPLLPFILSLTVAAVGVSVFHPVMYGVIDDSVHTRKAGFLGAFESWGGLTIVIMFIVVGVLLRAMSWKNVLLLVALPGAIAGVVFLRLPEPRISPRPAKQSDTRPPKVLLVAYLLSNMLRFFAITGVLSFVPTYFVYQVGLAPNTAAYAGALFFAGGVVGARLGGALGDKFNPYHVMLAALFVIAPLMWLLGTLSSVGALAAVLFVLGMVASGCSPLQNVLLRGFGPQMGSGEVFGIMMATLTITQALGPFVFGLAADRIGLALSVRLFSVPALASWILLLALSGSRHLRMGNRARLSEATG